MTTIKPYLSEFKFSKFLKLLFSLICLYFLREYLYLGINKFLITPFSIDKIKSNSNLDILSGILVFAVVVCFLHITLWRKLIPTINSIANIAMFLVFYWVVLRNQKIYNLEHINLIRSVKYLDIIFIVIIFALTKFKLYRFREESTLAGGFIGDHFNPDQNLDILGRANYSILLALKILETPPLSRAFVIAINSPWGFGKSGFLLLLERTLNIKDNDKFKTTLESANVSLDETRFSTLISSKRHTIIVRYNPWKNFDEKKVIQDFFSELSSAIGKYDNFLADKVQEYGMFLSKLDDSKFQKLVELSLDSINTKDTLTQLFDKINESIIRIKKRIIIFIDDLDRLDGEELIDILKLIRNTANFSNTFFIVAYDHNYVLNTIDKKNIISNKEEYLNKIVQLEVMLPIIQKDVLLEFLQGELDKNGIPNKTLLEIRIAINELLAITIPRQDSSINTISDNSNLGSIQKIDIFKEEISDSLFYLVLQNIRDVTRFINSFKLSLETIGKFGDIYEIILLDFLKTKYLSLYQLLSSKNFLTIEDQVYKFDKDLFRKNISNDVVSLINIKPNEIRVGEIIIEELFNSDRKGTFRSIKHPLYFELYFNYKVTSLAPLKKIESALGGGIDSIIEFINVSVENKSLFDIYSFLSSHTTFVNTEVFEVVFQALLYLSNHEGYRAKCVFQLKNMLRDSDQLNNLYKVENQLSGFLTKTLKEAQFDPIARAEITFDELYKIVNKNKDNHGEVDNLIKEKPVLQEILLGCLKAVMSSFDMYDIIITDVYIKNMEDIEEGTRKIKITAEANRLMRNFVEKHPYSYILQNIIRRHPEPSFSGVYYYIDPFLPFYFNNKWSDIRSFIESKNVAEFFESKNLSEKKYYQFVLAQTTEANYLLGKFLITDRELIKFLDDFSEDVAKRVAIPGT